ncbi:hypothetical protein LMG29660_03503 [Burkholderia puraquae]|uniref:Uncharacterized protein n=1 Tax=Burkholderia puraquae TaxID=1904757 RepID=A0A6J5DWJ9_9BURK|nr:hypothetical protein LMG29660_03503 [Burkholderia puraquae]
MAETTGPTARANRAASIDFPDEISPHTMWSNAASLDAVA